MSKEIGIKVNLVPYKNAMKNKKDMIESVNRLLLVIFYCNTKF